MPQSEKALAPTIFVIFGITGDLSGSKLLPALLDLYVKGKLPEEFSIIGFSRREFSPEEFRAFIKEAINRKNHGHSEELVEKFLNLAKYHQGLFDEPEHYGHLKKELEKIDSGFGQCSNKLFYLAVPPSQYEVIFENLGRSKLNKPCSGNTGWARILVEKPFGRDTETARELDKMLGQIFKEEQIFRIDHYLAKEALQNILAFRFANGMFEPLWGKNHISAVEIIFRERNDASDRGAFYDTVGALRDVGQNHMLQMLAVVAMEEPEKLEAKFLRDGRSQVFKKLVPIGAGDLESAVVRGQYEGFQSEKGVSRDSDTETYFALKAFVKNRRWKGVPFYLQSGKALDEDRAEITVHFSQEGKRAKHDKKQCRCNKLTFRIQPDEGIAISFWVKRPGFQEGIEEKRLSFNYESSGLSGEIVDAYELVLYDCVTGEQSRFTNTDEVKYAWRFITPILQNWHNLPLYTYKKGSKGPDKYPE